MYATEYSLHVLVNNTYITVLYEIYVNNTWYDKYVYCVVACGKSNSHVPQLLSNMSSTSK